MRVDHGKRLQFVFVLGLLLVSLTGCTKPFSTSPFFQSKLLSDLQQFLSAKGTVSSPAERSYVDPEHPDFHYRDVVVHVAMSRDKAQAMFGELKEFVLRQAAAGQATITNPNSNMASSMSDVDSSEFLYTTASGGFGRLYIRLVQGRAEFTETTDAKGKKLYGMTISTNSGDQFVVIVHLEESKKS
jgi:hypothetical protein